MAKKEKEQEFFLKLARPHQTGFRLGRHLIKAGPARPYSLNIKEMKELEGKGPKSWLKVVDQKEIDNAPKNNVENKKMQQLKAELAERVELNGDESLQELEEFKKEVEMFDFLVSQCKEKGIEVSGEESIEELEEKLAE